MTEVSHPRLDTAPGLLSAKMSRSRRSVTGRMSSPLPMSRTCDCNTSNKRMVQLFTTMYKAIASSGVLQDDCKSHQQYPRVVNSAEKEQEGGGRSRQRRTGGMPARARRTIKRAQERFSTPNTWPPSSSPPRTPTPTPPNTHSDAFSKDMSFYLYSDDAVDACYMFSDDAADNIPEQEGETIQESICSQVAPCQLGSISGHSYGQPRLAKVKYHKYLKLNQQKNGMWTGQSAFRFLQRGD